MASLSLVGLVGGLAAGMTGLVESAYLAASGAWGSVPVVGLVAAALGLLVAWPVALLGLAHRWACARTSRRWGRVVIALVAFGLLFALAGWLIEPWWRRLSWIYWGLAACFAAGGVGLLALAGETSVSVRLAGGILAATTCFAVERSISHYQYGELHSLLLFGTLLAVFPVATALARRASASRALLVLATPLALGWLASVDRAFSWWRFDAMHRGRMVTAATRIVHKAADFDGDGFSALAWGGDCNDRDPDVHPAAADPPGGGDSNCNRVDLDATSRPDELLAPPLGRAALAPERRRVMVFVLDALRFDHFSAEAMPRMYALARAGLRLTRCYAGGAETSTSVPLMHAPNQTRPSVLPTLRKAGVRVVGGENALAGLSGEQAELIRGTDLESVRQAALRLASETEGSFLFWSHPMPIHDPVDHPELDVPATPAHVPRSYRSTVRHVDLQLGQLWDELERRGLARQLTWVLTADHGEAFGEAGLRRHGGGGPDAVLRVPCAIWGPGIAAVQVNELASHRGLPATLLGLFGLEEEAGRAELMGRSWLRWLDVPAAKLQRRVMMRSARFTSGRFVEGHIIVLLDDEYRFLSIPEEGTFELFDANDHELRRNLAAEKPELAERYRAMAAKLGDLDEYPRRTTSRTSFLHRRDM